MSATTVPFAAKTAAETRDDILRVIANGLRRRGVAAPAVGPTSDYYLGAQALGDELEGIHLAAVVSADQALPDTASGAYMDRWLAAVGLSRRPPGPSTGRFVFATSATTLVPTGAELLDPNGGRVFVVAGGSYANGASITVQSRATGTATNLDGGTVLRWVTPPPFAQSTAALDAAGMSGGTDQEDDETARPRLLARLAVPPSAGNWEDAAETAETAAVEIQKAFVYAAANGPSTVHLAVTGYATSSEVRSRVVSDASLAAASAAIAALYTEAIETVVTKTVDSPADVAWILTLPEAVSAVPAGTGGGWIDGAPWPSTDSSVGYAWVSAVTSTTDITIKSDTVPSGGESISWIDRTTFTLRTAKIATVVSVSGSGPSTVRVTLDTPFSGVAVNDWIMPASVRGAAYLAAVLTAFAALGPGEKTDAAGLLPRAFRKPRYFTAYPYTLGANFTRALSDAGEEVLDVAWSYQNGGTTTPALPATIDLSPAVFTPRRIGWWRA